MEKRALIKISLAAGLVAAVGAFGCSAAESDDASTSPDQVVAGGTAGVLKSVLVLETGCTATKVGPKHLLLAARCVQGNAALAAGKTVKFTSAAAGNTTIQNEGEDEVLGPAAPTDAGSKSDAAASDAGKSDASASDAGGAKADAGAAKADAGAAKTSTNASGREVTIAEVNIHPSFAAKCSAADACAFGKLEGSDAPDLAVLVLKDELSTVPTIPVDLDAVGQADPLLVVSSGCLDFEATDTAAPKTFRTIAVPAKVVAHEGSPYKASPQLTTRLGASYVVTAGAAWQAGATRLCKSDIGAPVFRAGSGAVAGVTSNFTTYTEASKTPVTIHHTRLDTGSRFKIGTWLGDLGVETIHSCSEAAGGCVKREYDGGVPKPTTGDVPRDGTTSPGDAGTGDAIAPGDGGASGDASATPEEGDNAPTGPRGETLPSEDPEGDYASSEDEADYSDAAAPKKKKKAAEGGCSTTPGRPAPMGSIALGVLVALGMAAARRRR